MPAAFIWQTLLAIDNVFLEILLFHFLIFAVKTVDGANKNLRTAEQSFKKLDQDQDRKLNKVSTVY